MTTAADIRQLSEATTPLIEQWIDLAEQFAAIRDAASEKGVDWSQFKALHMARGRDARDGGHRVEKLIEKADFAQSYAGMLGMANMNENGKVHSSSPAPVKPAAPRVSVAAGAVIPASAVADEIDLTVPAFLARNPDNSVPR